MEHKLISHSLDHPLTLEDHIYQVCRAAKYLVSQKSLNFNGISKEQIVELCTLTALCHDFGKSTAFFQEYIRSKKDGTEYEGNTRDKSHSLISAFFGWHTTEKWISRNDRLAEHWKSFLPLAVFLAIDGHHGRYKSIEDVLKSVDENYNLLERQIDRIQPEIYEYESSGFKLSDGKDLDIGTIESISGKIRKLNRKYGKINLDIQIEHRILALFLYSILLESDKAYLASDDPKQYERDPRDSPDDLVDRYLKTLETDGDINEERRRAYEETISNVGRFPLTERIHSITLPTGLGKTLLSASWALKLRKRIGREEGIVPKIIVSLPFLSIIEQTDDVYKKFLGALYEREEDRLYMPRYSISDFKYRNGIDDEERSDNSVDFFLNIWNSEIIASTFDQLLYSLFSLKSKHLMRFHNLFNAIIVFDEIQALPSELWKPFEYFFKKLSEVGGTHILLMSATQPKFFPCAKERVPEHEEYFKSRRRVNLHIKPKERSLESFIENLPDLLNEHSDESMMIVLNTRDSSKSIYKKIGGMIDEKTILERPLIYLSSLVAPSQRTNRILDIKRCIEKELNPIIVTTQCIEAGVDIDVDHIVRDWAPLDSIFQVCGRCNRNGQKETGGVEIVRLMSDAGRFFSDMVYDPILLDCTAFSVSGNIEIPEERFYSLGSRYFESVRERLGKSMEIVRAYAQYTHKYGETVVNIKELLRGDERQEQFIISSLDEDLLKDIEKALEINDRWKRRYAMKGLGKRIAANSVSVRFEKWMPVRPDDLTIDPIRNFRILDEQFYDAEGVGLDVDLKNPIGGTVIC
jgi:CRISPR-associated endonuclease/helicase Cas3